MIGNLINGATDILGGSIIRYDLNTTTPTQAVIRKIIAGTGVSITSTGVDSGTGDVTINLDVSGIGGGLLSLNGLSISTQTFATSTTGTNFTITSSGSVHTFNLPDASATARGLVSTGTQTFAGDKTLSGIITLSNLSGSGTRMVVVTNTGVLSSQTIPSGGGSGSLPIGGTGGQILAKIDSVDYNTTWIDNFTSQVKHEVKLGATLTKGTPVYVSNATGTNMIVSAASNTSEPTSSKTMGLLQTGGVTNDIVYVITEGLLAGLDTSTATIGAPVWLGANGTLIYGLANKPVAPNHLVFIGIVTRVQSNNGEIFVKVQNGFEIEELHNVLFTSKADKDLMYYDNATSLWKNAQLSTILGYTPANDSAVVHITGSETITGIKTFSANVLFGSSLRYDSSNSSIGVGLVAAASAGTFLEIAASTSVKSSIRFNSGVALTTPVAGDLWYTGGTTGSLYFYNGTTTIALSNGTITSVTASGSVSGIVLSSNTSSGAVTITLGGTLSVLPSNFSTQGQNTFLAAPSGTSGVPSFRTILAADIPTLNQNTTGSAATLTTARSIYGNSFNGSADLTQIIASTYGGTGNGFTKFTGPTTAEKTFTLPDASATILTTNAAVTVAQGGTGATTLTGILVGNGTSAVTAIIGTASQLLRRNAGNTAYEFFTPTYISGNENITLSGDVTGSGTTAITTTLATITQGSGTSFVKITLDTKGRVTGNTAVGSTDITTALGYTPYNSTNPSGYITSTGSITGSAGSVTNSITFNTTGGAVAGTTYNGSAARTIDYTTVGAAAASHTHAWSAITSGLPTTISGYGITDAYTKTEVDSFLQGLDPKASVVAATTASITLSGTQTIDGVAVVAGNRVLVKNQATGSENGIYIVSATAWSRSTDMDAAAEFPGSYCFVEQGTTNQDSAWVCTNDAVTLGTTAITFVKFAGSGAYQSTLNGTGYVKMSGTTVSYISSIPITDLAASTISGISLGNNLAALTINNSGTGAASGSTYNGSTAVTISYNSIGAQPLASNLTSLAGLSYPGSGAPFVKMTAANTFTLDTNVYLTTNQTITFTPSGDISGSTTGATSLLPALTTTGLRGVALPTLGASAGFLRYTGTGTNTWIFDTSSYLTSITLTGDVTSTGFATTIASGAVTLAKMANLAANSIIGNNTGTAATPLALTGTQVTAMLDNFTSTTKGLVPLSGGGTTNFLRADGSWAAPAGGGGSSTPTINRQSANYTIAASDANNIIEFAASGNFNLTVPDNTTVPLANGTTITVSQYSTGSVQIVAGSGVTIISATGNLYLNGRYTQGILQKTNANEWYFHPSPGVLIFNRQTANYTLTLSDAGEVVEMNIATATSATNTVTVPPNASVPFPIGTQIIITQYGTSVTSVVAGGGVTVRSANGSLTLNAQWSAATLVKVATDEWYFYGGISQGNEIRTVVLGTDSAPNSTVTAATSGISFPVAANKNYYFKFTLFVTNTGTATGGRYTINGTGLTLGTVRYRVRATQSTTQPTTYGATTIERVDSINALGTLSGTTTSVTPLGATATNIVIIEGFITSTTAGTVDARFAAAATSATMIVRANSFVNYQMLR